ncbi:hypothetical protein DXN05_20370 [Deminuibacter soli]|uniref:Uncharacterized protein n=1 Tax=Deminuibacter soli TaxID=2291815 RepID=A0A3E1NER9_9BACT|nr:hypothetical protein DXN05_20370 [Deminuibacter soli]
MVKTIQPSPPDYTTNNLFLQYPTSIKQNNHAFSNLNRVVLRQMSTLTSAELHQYVIYNTRFA